MKLLIMIFWPGYALPMKLQRWFSAGVRLCADSTHCFSKAQANKIQTRKSTPLLSMITLSVQTALTHHQVQTLNRYKEFPFHAK
ncbi:hypothetical protein CSR02_03560 [Acetobacter pomorum]|uniref:Uncharacterized protein n=1 Tax=Acetobacter pomorum TaxID=65959 RepID=A0A2G4REH3_9PROT|nr:hypothetical protein CSR02_03560 [Acetobacter pomorum]